MSWRGYLLLCSKVGSSYLSDLAVVNVLLTQCCPLMHCRASYVTEVQCGEKELWIQIASANLVWPDCADTGCSGCDREFL